MNILKRCTTCGREGWPIRGGHFWYFGQMHDVCIDCYERMPLVAQKQIQADGDGGERWEL